MGRTFKNWHFLDHSPHHASSVPLVLSTQTGLISPQFHCVFDDDFDMVRKEQADTSNWKIKAHLQEAKERVTETTTRSSLISNPKNQPVNSLPPYGRDIPQALHNLSQLLPDVPTLEEDHQPEELSIPPTEEPTSQIDNSAAQDPIKSRWTTTNQKDPQTIHHLLLRPRDTPKLATKSTNWPGLLMQLTTAKPWPKLVSGPSSTSTHLPASEHLHPPLPNLMGILMQCHLMWQCNNQTRKNSSMPWHGS